MARFRATFSDSACEFYLDEVLQDKFTIPHPDGDLNINAPNVFDTSKPLRLKGKGFPGGDMYVMVNEKICPTSLR